MKTMKKIKMIIAIIVAILSLVGVVGMFCNDISTMFVMKQIPKIHAKVEEDIIEYQRLEKLIAVKNLQIDSLARIQNKTEIDQLKKSNYELTKSDYEQQKNIIELDIKMGYYLITLVLYLTYLAVFIFSIVYLREHIHLGNKN